MSSEVTLTDAERQPCEVWTRCMGYHRPVSAFNPGKKGEFAERLPFCTAKTEDALRIASLPAATGETTGYTAGTA